MSLNKGRQFSTGTSSHRKRQMSTLVQTEGAFGPALTVSLSRAALFPLVCFDHIVSLAKLREASP